MSKAPGKAGTVKMGVTPKGSAKTKLSKAGKLTLKVKVSFTPRGGKAAARTKKIKLVKRR